MFKDVNNEFDLLAGWFRVKQLSLNIYISKTKCTLIFNSRRAQNVEFLSIVDKCEIHVV